MHTLISRFPFISGFLVGFFGVYFSAVVSPDLAFDSGFIFIATFLILEIISSKLNISDSNKKALLFCVIILAILMFITTNQSIRLYKIAETMIEKSAIVCAIGVFLLGIWKLSIETCRLRKEIGHKEQDLRLKREIFEYEKMKDESTE